MRYLLDTHIVLWYITDSEKLSDNVKEAINSSYNDIYYSIVSVWEVAIKHQISISRMPVSDEDFSRYAECSGMTCLALSKEHIAALKTLKMAAEAGKHHDPFDRMLIAQAKTEGMTLISHDRLLRGYGENCIVIV
ncbi:MAG: type II toxin-antitoxin system VapC family toxin [Synergistaceae bacterium]|nr:type II toxin-antitoxin system VapC family toxin [Synergistaceae bacterium]